MKEIDDELYQIYEKHDALTPKLVVEAARDPQSPLHPYFDWSEGDDENKRSERALGMIMKCKNIVQVVPKKGTD